MILQFSTDYACFKVSVQTVSLARSARLSHVKNVLQHVSWAQAVKRSRTISLPDTSITKLLREFERAYLNEHAIRTGITLIFGNTSESTRASLAGKIHAIEKLR